MGGRITCIFRPHGGHVSAIIDTVDAGRILEMAKNSTGNKYSAILLDEDDPEMPVEYALGTPSYVEVIFTRPDGKEIRKLGTRPNMDGNLGDDNEIYYTNSPGDGVNDMYGLWRYTVAATMPNGTRVRSKESVRWYCVRGDDVIRGPADPPA